MKYHFIRIKEFILKTGVIFLFLVLFCLQVYSEMEPVKVPVLMYHHISGIKKSDPKTLKYLTVTTQKFERQLIELKKSGYTPISFYQLFNYFTEAHGLPSKPIVITFDDGYSDQWQAFQILVSYNMTAVFFVVTNTLNTKNHLSSNQLKIMSDRGMEIASHGTDHIDLSIRNKSLQTHQIINSKNKIERITGKKVISFAFPAGKYNSHTKKLLLENGFWFARTTKVGISDINEKNLEIKMIRMFNETSPVTLINSLFRQSAQPKI